MEKDFEKNIFPREQDFSQEQKKEKEEKIQIPEVSRHLSFIKEAAYPDLSSAKIEQIEISFKDAFNRLSEDEQTVISLEMQTLGRKIDILDKSNKAVAEIKQRDIVSSFNKILEESGVFDSLKEGGFEQARQQLSELAKNTAASLRAYKTFVQGIEIKEKLIRTHIVKDGKIEYLFDAVAEQKIEYLFDIISKITQELERLGLISDVSNIQFEGESPAFTTVKVKQSVEQLGQKLKSAIKSEGLIGFSMLDKLLDEFLLAEKILVFRKGEAKEK